MSKSSNAAGSAGGAITPAPKPDSVLPVWVVLLAAYRGVDAGRLARVTSREAEALIDERAARVATDIDHAIGAALARDLTI